MNFGSDLLHSVSLGRHDLPTHFIAAWIIPQHHEYQWRFAPHDALSIAVIVYGDQLPPPLSSI
jgi:hypothetical protein